MKYHLVALFDNRSNDFFEKTQQNLCKRYRLQKINQKFYIPIQTIINPDMDKYNKIVLDILSPYKKFKIKFNPKIHLDNYSKSLSLKVEKKGYIIRISKKITNTLELNGFTVKPNYENNFSIFLANSTYTLRKQLNSESAITISSKNSKKNEYAKIDRLELWKVINNRKRLLIKSYNLREY